MPVTINDVAREAGVSITTVSRVVNNNYPVKRETREKIEKAIEKLNYKPNIMARGLITKKTSVVGVIVPGITNLFFPTIVESIEQRIKDDGYSISLCNTGGEFSNEVSIVDNMISRQADGIIAIDPSVESLESNFYGETSKRIPTIIVNGFPGSYDGNFVCYDEATGTREAFNYLLELGHRRIAFVRGHRSFSYDLKESIYRDFVKDNDLGYENIIDVGKGNSIEVTEKAQHFVENIFKQNVTPTAIFACNDLMAVGSINACRNIGIKVPQDVSIIGFDNTLLASITHPGLTSVDQNMVEIGHRAAEELLDIMELQEENYKRIILSTNLVIRESTAPCSED